MTDSDRGRSSAGQGGAGEGASLAGETSDDTEPGELAVTADLEELRQQLDQRQDTYVRLAADFENYKRRRAQEAADRARYASEDAARALLPVLDNLQRAVESAPPGVDEGFLDGVRLTARQFQEALAGLGVEPVDAVGEPFDPAVHEAIAGEESGDVDRDTVVAELQRGYRLHDRLLRPALVRVAHPAGRGAG